MYIIIFYGILIFFLLLHPVSTIFKDLIEARRRKRELLKELMIFKFLLSNKLVSVENKSIKENFFEDIHIKENVFSYKGVND